MEFSRFLSFKQNTQQNLHPTLSKNKLEISASMHTCLGTKIRTEHVVLLELPKNLLGIENFAHFSMAEVYLDTIGAML